MMRPEHTVAQSFAVVAYSEHAFRKSADVGTSGLGGVSGLAIKAWGSKQPRQGCSAGNIRNSYLETCSWTSSATLVGWMPSPGHPTFVREAHLDGTGVFVEE